MSRSGRAWRVAAALALCSSTGATVLPAPPSTSLRSVQGTVLAVSGVLAEGELEVVAVRIESVDPDPLRRELLLAPRSVLEEIEFAVEVGDVLRATVFVTESGPLTTHKVMNLTRGTIVRLRTLHGVPLWDATGKWEGGARPGAGHGAGGRGRGKGPRY